MVSLPHPSLDICFPNIILHLIFQLYNALLTHVWGVFDFRLTHHDPANESKTLFELSTDNGFGLRLYRNPVNKTDPPN